MNPPSLGAMDSERIVTGATRPPRSHLSDLWRAPLHDFPIRNEIVYQYLPLTPGMSLLEIGPGDGFAAFRLTRMVRRMVSVDIAAGNVASLKQALRGATNLSFICADVARPGFAQVVGGQFDAAFALEVLEYVLDPLTCFKNLADVLRPGGRLLIEWPNYPPGVTGGSTYFAARSQVDGLLRAAGFASWDLYALRLRPWASCVWRHFHERPLRLLRRLRRKGTGGLAQHEQRGYDQTWAFQSQQRLQRSKLVVHLAWALLAWSLGLGGDCFERIPLTGEGLDGNLLLLARR